MLHDTPVLALAPSPDGALLASGDKGGGIKVWRVATGVLLLRLDAAHAAGVTALAFSPDGSRLLSAGYDGAARVHGLKSGRQLSELRGHTSYVLAAAYTPDGASIRRPTARPSDVFARRVRACVSGATALAT